MKVAVIGSRSFSDYQLVCDNLKHIEIDLLISGGAIGADSLGEKYANENNIPTKIFLPDWEKHGKMAGFIRNTDIITEADVIVAFWDNVSKGTADSIEKGKKLNKKIIIINTNK